MSEPLPPDPPRPLEYRSPRDEPPQNVAVHFTYGLLIAFAGVGCAGVITILPIYGMAQSGRQNPGKYAALAFGGVAILATALTITFWKRTARLKRRWLVLGFLAGVGVACLIEGLCFAKQ